MSVAATSAAIAASNAASAKPYTDDGRKIYGCRRCRMGAGVRCTLRVAHERKHSQSRLPTGLNYRRAARYYFYRRFRSISSICALAESLTY